MIGIVKSSVGDISKSCLELTDAWKKIAKTARLKQGRTGLVHMREWVFLSQMVMKRFENIEREDYVTFLILMSSLQVN